MPTNEDTPTQEADVDRWIFLLQVRSRPGVLSAITAVFADRGISIESLTAHDSSRTGQAYGTVLLTFLATPVKKDYLARLLHRSATVQDIVEYRYEDAAHARKSILVRVILTPEALKRALPPRILCDIVSAHPGETLALLLGPPLLLDQAVSALNPAATLEASEPNLTVI